MNTKLSGFRFFSVARKAALALGLCGGIAAGPKAGGNDPNQTTKAEGFRRVPVWPVATGHHGPVRMVGNLFRGRQATTCDSLVLSVRRTRAPSAKFYSLLLSREDDKNEQQCEQNCNAEDY